MNVEESLDRLAVETGFSGVVRIDRGDEVELAEAYGLAQRGFGVPNTTGTRFAIASGTKGLTALTVMSLVEDRILEPGTLARSLLGDDLPLIDDAATVEQLLALRSGIGDYLDEDAGLDVTAHLTRVPVHELATTEQYVRVLDGYPMKFAPGERFSYCNSGYVVLALIAERATGTPFHDLVRERVCEKAGMRATAFLRSDELPGDAATGYIDTDGLRTNVLHLPVRGSGDGGTYSTAADITALWRAMFEGRIVPHTRIADMTRPHSTKGSKAYGLGFWLEPARGAVVLEGSDAGVSFRSVHLPQQPFTYTVMSNTTEGAWPIARRLADLLTPGSRG